jgi:hypothetical protein
MTAPKKTTAKAAPKDTGPSDETRQLVIARDAETCQWCGKPIRDHGFGYSLQHRVARGMGGTSDPAINSPANLVLVGGSGTTDCHGYIESHPNEARERGFRVDRDTDPADVALVPWNGVAIHLDHEGGKA